MTAGRNQVEYTDIGFQAQTYKIDGVTITYDRTKPNGIGIAAGAGLAVTLSDDDTVALTADGSFVEGKVIKVEADGFATFGKGDSGIGTATRGRKIVGATLAGVRGFVRDVNTATAAELGVCDGEIINTADAANIVVDL